MIEINRPKIKYTEGENDQHGIIEVEPLERGYGQTLGTAFRRVLLSSLPGSAVCSVKIDGVLHEFCSIPGIVEDVTAIILNLKKLVVNVECDDIITIRLDAKEPCVVTAADLPPHPDLLIIDDTTHICQITGDINLGMNISFKRGRGYVLAEHHTFSTDEEVGLILVDSQFSPVTRVMYNVSEARVGQEINFDKLTLHVITNGGMQPPEAVEIAAQFLKSHVDLFETLESEVIEKEGVPLHGETLVMISNQPKEAPQKGNHDILIKDLEFSVRSRNCLKKASISTLGELANKKVSYLLEIKNFGKKSLKEVREKLAQFGMSLPDDDESIDGGNDE